MKEYIKELVSLVDIEKKVLKNSIHKTFLMNEIIELFKLFFFVFFSKITDLISSEKIFSISGKLCTADFKLTAKYFQLSRIHIT